MHEGLHKKESRAHQFAVTAKSWTYSGGFMLIFSVLRTTTPTPSSSSKTCSLPALPQQVRHSTCFQSSYTGLFELRLQHVIYMPASI